MLPLAHLVLHEGSIIMTRTILRTTFIAAASALAAGLFASKARAEEVAPQFLVDCWIGMKWGDQPGQLIRGWICERPSIPAAKTDQRSSASAPNVSAPEEDEDVAAIRPSGIRR
jgi:hypothetical protein